MDRLIEIPGQERPENPLEKLMKQMGGMAQYLQHIETGLFGMHTQIQEQGLAIGMLVNILVEKGVCTPEEVKEYQEKFIAEPMREQMEEFRRQAQQQAQMQQSEVVEEEEEDNPDVVLASEKSNVVRFPDGQDS